jgi:ABC-type phosphate transport system permease subunit
VTEVAAQRDVATGATSDRRGPATAPSRSWTEIGSEVGDRIYSWTIAGFAFLVPALLLIIFVALGIAAWPALREFGFSFLTSSEWDPVAGHFGAAAAI